jgi:hypothetical protein
MVQWVHALALTFPAASTRQRLHALTDQLRSQGEWPPHELRLMLRAWGAPAEQHPVAWHWCSPRPGGVCVRVRV